MAIIGALVIGFIILVMVGYVLYLFRTVIIIGTFLLAAYLIFFTDYLILGILVGIGWLMLARVFEEIEEGSKEEDRPIKRKKREGGFYSSSSHNKRKKPAKRGLNYNYLLMWLIPLFWPFLIFQTFFRDKPAGVLNEYDYEQHLKSNGK